MSQHAAPCCSNYNKVSEKAPLDAKMVSHVFSDEFLLS